ncbi:MAG: formylglycine-generating enzyme family protein [Pseudomonadota bacterium]
MTKTLSEDLQARIRAIAEAEADDLVELARFGRLDPARDFRFRDLTGVDFRLPDVVDLDFTGANLCACEFVNAELFGVPSGWVADGPLKKWLPNIESFARFDQAILGQLIHPDDPHQPARLTAPIANLREAADWWMYRHAWTRPSQWPDDAHLPIGAIFQDAPFAPEMVVVPPGAYTQGDETKPVDGINRREVTIAYRFAVGRFPVTFEEWDFAVETGGATHKPGDEGWGRGRRPVINVAWNDIVESYLPWLNERLGLPAGSGYRLLTEAEWEYCCRAGTDTSYCNGDDPSRLGDVAWFNKNSGRKTQPVGEKDANAFGLHDMHGNVWEWCQDAYAGRYAGAPEHGDARDGDDPSVSRVLRGGCWLDRPEDLRAASRGRAPLDLRDWEVGFRLARTLNL